MYHCYIHRGQFSNIIKAECAAFACYNESFVIIVKRLF